MLATTQFSIPCRAALKEQEKGGKKRDKMEAMMKKRKEKEHMKERKKSKLGSLATCRVRARVSAV